MSEICGVDEYIKTYAGSKKISARSTAHAIKYALEHENYVMIMEIADAYPEFYDKLNFYVPAEIRDTVKTGVENIRKYIQKHKNAETEISISRLSDAL